MDINMPTGTMRISNLLKVERTGAHSHITGLGVTLESTESDNDTSSGMFGQIKARRSAALIMEMIKINKMSGKAVMITGPSGTGKTAIAVALAKSLGTDFAFSSMAASEFFNIDISKAEVLTQAIRKATQIRFSEQTEVVEGEIVKFDVIKQNGMTQGTLTMRTLDMEATLTLGENMTKLLIEEKATPGDVVCINNESLSFEKLGKCIATPMDCDILNKNTLIVDCPGGELRKIKNVEHVTTLHDIDAVNYCYTQGFTALFNGETGEISQEVRNAVNKKMITWVETGKAVVTPGVLFIDEIHLLDEDCFAFINREIEKDNAPLLIIATNREFSQIRGTKYYAPWGVPSDVTDRMMIISTEKYNKEELRKIVQIRILEECINMSENAMEALSKIAYYKSLRYALNLLPVADTIATTRKHNPTGQIDLEDLKKAYTLFIDQKRSADYMNQMKDEFTTEDSDDERDNELLTYINPLFPLALESQMGENEGELWSPPMTELIASPDLSSDSDSDSFSQEIYKFAIFQHYKYLFGNKENNDVEMNSEDTEYSGNMDVCDEELFHDGNYKANEPTVDNGFSVKEELGDEEGSSFTERSSDDEGTSDEEESAGNTSADEDITSVESSCIAKSGNNNKEVGDVEHVINSKEVVADGTNSIENLSGELHSIFTEECSDVKTVNEKMEGKDNSDNNGKRLVVVGTAKTKNDKAEIDGAEIEVIFNNMSFEETSVENVVIVVANSDDDDDSMIIEEDTINSIIYEENIADVEIAMAVGSATVDKDGKVSEFDYETTTSDMIAVEEIDANLLVE